MLEACNNYTLSPRPWEDQEEYRNPESRHTEVWISMHIAILTTPSRDLHEVGVSRSQLQACVLVRENSCWMLLLFPLFHSITQKLCCEVSQKVRRITAVFDMCSDITLSALKLPCCCSFLLILLNFHTIFFFIFVCTYFLECKMCVQSHIVHICQKISDALELERYLLATTWMLMTEPRYSARGASALNHWAISSPLKWF